MRRITLYRLSHDVESWSIIRQNIRNYHITKQRYLCRVTQKDSRKKYDNI